MVRFAPTASGSSSGTLTITGTNAAKTSAVALLSGTAVAAPAPSIALSTNAIDFGSVDLDQTKDVSVTIRNTGIVDLVVSSVVTASLGFSVIVPNTPFTVV